MMTVRATHATQVHLAGVHNTWRGLLAWVTDRPWLALPLLALPACLTFFRLGLPKGVDTLMHLMRLGALDYAVRHGVLYPRWIPELMVGHGYPVFNFYGPLTYYLVETWRLLGLSYYSAWIAGCVLLIPAAGCGMYLLARGVFGVERPWAALVAATAYMYAPYLLTNLYVRGAIAEVGAQALLPWVLWSFRQLLVGERPNRYLTPAALSLGAMAVCHNITLLFVPPVLIAYGALLWWSHGRRPARLGWAALAIVAAVGASAFFVLPLAGERGFLITAPYAASRYTLPENAWRWDAFVDLSLIFKYSSAIPFRMGLVQVAVALAGLILARRRDGEWWFLAGVAVASGLAITRFSLPLWLNVPLLLIAQFPWRLLSIMSLPLALLSGGCVVGLRSRRAQVGIATALIALVVFAQTPRLGAWMVTFLAPDTTELTPAVTTQLETGTRALGASGIQEFRPRWAIDDLTLAPEAGLPAAQASISLERANAFDLGGTVDSQSGGPLRFLTYYYPGWRVMLDDSVALRAYPSTNLGLLTADLPPGRHRISVTWAGTPLQHASGVLTLLTLLALAWFAWRGREWRLWAVLPAALLIVALAALLWPHPLAPVQLPVEPLKTEGLQMLGYRLETGLPAAADPYINIYPYWQVTAPQPADLSVHWQLRDATDQVVAESTMQPYFNSTRASDWPAGSLVDDAYQIALPPDLLAGSYRLTAALRGSAASPGPGVTVARIDLPGTDKAKAVAPYATDLRLGEAVKVAGYGASAGGRPLVFGDRPPSVRAGQILDYTVFWQALAPVATNYFGFVHLLGVDGRPIAQHDQTPGPMFRPSMLWDRYNLQPDHHSLWIPANAASGLYWPSVGLHEFKSQERLPAFDAQGQELPEGIRLPPIKVLGPPPPPPQRSQAANFNDVADLLGYDLEPPGGTLRAGQALTLTLYYRSKMATPIDYTRFVHVTGPAGQIAGYDSLPRDGANPTWSWLPGERIADPVTVTMPADAAAGAYTLSMGFYDRRANGARLRATDGGGQPLANDEVVLTQLTVSP